MTSIRNGYQPVPSWFSGWYSWVGNPDYFSAGCRCRAAGRSHPKKSYWFTLCVARAFWEAAHALLHELFYLYNMKVIECPRDAMQGLQQFIETERKVEYLNALLQVGFDTLDFGSFVSAKMVPQMRDTPEVLQALQRGGSSTKLLAIVANVRGALDALAYRQIDYLGFPLSISQTFQMRNTNKSIEDAFLAVQEINRMCEARRRTLVVYISMAFGNPYGDQYSIELVSHFVACLAGMGISVVSLADTIGISSPEAIRNLVGVLRLRHPEVELGAHLHSHPANAREKIRAALDAGCNRLDGAMGGFGGCPFASDKLVGNVATEEIISCLEAAGEKITLDRARLGQVLTLSGQIFKNL